MGGCYELFEMFFLSLMERAHAVVNERKMTQMWAFSMGPVGAWQGVQINWDILGNRTSSPPAPFTPQRPYV